MHQPVIGFHRDADGDWVAVLGCLHFQHVRHKPPWQNREWVTTEAGRNASLGRMLSCVKCQNHAPRDTADSSVAEPLRVPANFVSYKKTPVFDQHTVPKGLQKEHATANGVWAVLQVLSGSLIFRFMLAGEWVSCEVIPDRPRVIVAEQPHHVVIDGPVSFQLEFFRLAR